MKSHIINPYYRASSINEDDTVTEILPMCVTVTYYIEAGDEVGRTESLGLDVDVAQVYQYSDGALDAIELADACEEAAYDFIVGKYGHCDYIECNEFREMFPIDAKEKPFIYSPL